MSYIEKLQSFNRRSDYQQECSRLLSVMRPNIDGPVLDIGCGIGGTMDILRENGINVYGIDPVKSHVSFSGNNKVVQGNGEAIPFRDNLFSAVYYMHSIAHISNPTRSLQEAARTLKPGGSLYIVTPNSRFERLIKPVKSALENVGRFEPDNTVARHYSPPELRTLMSAILDDVAISTFGKLGFQRIIASGKLQK